MRLSQPNLRNSPDRISFRLPADSAERSGGLGDPISCQLCVRSVEGRLRRSAPVGWYLGRRPVVSLVGCGRGTSFRRKWSERAIDAATDARRLRPSLVPKDCNHSPSHRFAADPSLSQRERAKKLIPLPPGVFPQRKQRSEITYPPPLTPPYDQTTSRRWGGR